MITDTIQDGPHKLWQQVVKHEKRDNNEYQNEYDPYNFGRAAERLENIQKWKMKQGFYRKHLDKYIRKGGVNPISHDSAQRDLTNAESAKQMRINSFSPMQRTEFIRAKEKAGFNSVLKSRTGSTLMGDITKLARTNSIYISNQRQANSSM